MQHWLYPLHPVSRMWGSTRRLRGSIPASWSPDQVAYLLSYRPMSQGTAVQLQLANRHCLYRVSIDPDAQARCERLLQPKHSSCDNLTTIAHAVQRGLLTEVHLQPGPHGRCAVACPAYKGHRPVGGVILVTSNTVITSVPQGYCRTSPASLSASFASVSRRCHPSCRALASSSSGRSSSTASPRSSPSVASERPMPEPYRPHHHQPLATPRVAACRITTV